MNNADRLAVADGEIGVWPRRSVLLGGGPLEFLVPGNCPVRLTGPQPGEGPGVPGVWAAAEGPARARIPLVKHLKVIVGIDLLALTQAQCRQAGPKPHAGRLTLLSGIHVVAAGRPLATIRPGSTGRPQRILRVMPGGERHLVSHDARLPSCLKDLVVMIMVFTELTKITTSAMVRWLDWHISG
jgi:hypothetical protein